MSARDIVKGYVSLAALVGEAVSKQSVMPDNERASRRAVNGGPGEDWAGGSWPEASKLAQSGDMAGARRLRADVLTTVNSIVTGMPRLDPVYRLDEGCWIDVARFVKGEPECWGDMVEADPMPRRGAAVIINVAASSNVTSTALDNLGINIGGAVLGLQAQGIAVVVYAAEKISMGIDDTLLIHAPINPGGSSLDISRLSTVLRPWFLRRVLFSLEETYDTELRTRFGIVHGGGYGRPEALVIEDAKLISGRDNAVVINVNKAVRNPSGVKDLILSQTKGAI